MSVGKRRLWKLTSLQMEQHMPRIHAENDYLQVYARPRYKRRKLTTCRYTVVRKVYAYRYTNELKRTPGFNDKSAYPTVAEYLPTVLSKLEPFA